MPDLDPQEYEALERAELLGNGGAIWRAARNYYRAALAAREEPQDRWAEDEWHTDENGHVIGGAPPNFVFVAKSSAREDWIAERSNVEKERDELLAAREEQRDDEPGYLLAELLWAVKQARGMKTDTDLERVYKAEERAELELETKRTKALAAREEAPACEHCGHFWNLHMDSGCLAVGCHCERGPERER